jgi:hypothetical protein
MFDATNVDAHVHLRCEIAGYQFPATLDDDWCLVRVSVRQGQDHFERVDPALEANDLIRIRDWFRALAADRLPRYAHLGFIEPCLGFEFLARDDAGVRFAVLLSHELRPHFQLRQLGAVSDDWIVVFHLDPARLAAVAAAIDAAIARFPVRSDPTLRE